MRHLALVKMPLGPHSSSSFLQPLLLVLVLYSIWPAAAASQHLDYNPHCQLWHGGWHVGKPAWHLHMCKLGFGEIIFNVLLGKPLTWGEWNRWINMSLLSSPRWMVPRHMGLGTESAPSLATHLCNSLFLLPALHPCPSFLFLDHTPQ